MSHLLYIHITEQCREEAKNFNLLEQLQKLKAKVEKDQNLMQFEVFEFPYQVKKYFAYQYRLVTHIATVNYQDHHYRILTFLKIYHRGDKSYEKWYINARQHGDSVYKQRNVAKEIEALLPNLVQHSNETVLDNSFANYFLNNYRIDIFNLAQSINEYYVETPTWRFDITRKLSPEQLKKYQLTLFHAIEKQENISLKFENHIKNITPPFQKYEPIIYHPYIACNMQEDSAWLGLNHERTLPYQRAVPLELALDENLWSLTQQTTLPFQLNTLQQHCIDALFNKYQSYPFIIQADKNMGKTTLLALLYSHFFVQERIADECPSPYPCLLICEEHEQEYLHQSILNYLKLRTQWHGLEFKERTLTEVMGKLSDTCLSLKQYLWQHLSATKKSEFLAEHYIDASRFAQLYYHYFSALSSHEFEHLLEQTDLVWRVIQYEIKGKNIDEPTLSHKLSELLTEEEFQFIYEKIYKGWYVNLQKNNRYWDLQDLVIYIDQYDIQLTPYIALLCDQSHDLSEIALSILLKQNYWFYRGYTEQIHQIPLIFSCYDSPSAYINSWQENLYKILSEITQFNQFDSPNHHELKTIIPYIYTQEVNAITSLFNHYYNQLVLKKRFLSEFQENSTPIRVHFVSEQNEELLIPLLQQHDIPWIIYDGVLSTKSSTHQTSLQEYYQARLTNTHSQLPTKNRAVILVNFDDVIYQVNDYLQKHQYHRESYLNACKEELQYYLQRYKETPVLTRYRLECLLHHLETAIQQGLNDIYIVSACQENFKLWQQFFQHPNIHFSALQLNDVQHYQMLHQQELVEPDKPLLTYVEELRTQTLNDSIILMKIHYYQCHFRINDQFDYEVVLAYSLKKIDAFFKLHQQHKYRYKMIALLVTLHDMEKLQQYKHFINDFFKNHVECLNLLHNEAISLSWINQYAQMIHRICHMKLYNTNHDPIWQVFWSKLYQQLYEKFLTCPEARKEQYQQLYEYVQQAIQFNQLYHIELWAYLHFKLEKYQQAINIWQTAMNQRLIQHYPIFYHQAKIQTLSTIDERLDYLFNFDTHFKIQELLKMNLNELQAEYWQKILQHLHEEDDLEPILSQLLPSIDSQDVLARLYDFCKMNPDTEAFSVRVQRIKSFWACITSDWFVIEDRLTHYKPLNNLDDVRHSLMAHFQNVQNTKHRQKNKGKTTYHFPDEVLDMLYALNLNRTICVPSEMEDWQQYQQKERVQTAFELLKDIFAFMKDEDEMTWKTNFQSIRALCCLMEKSPDLELPFSLYYQLLHEYNEKDVLYPFFLQRLFVITKRIQIYDAENTRLVEHTQRFETKFKKSLQQFNLENLELEPPVLKQISEILKSILAISPQENSVLQQLEREEAKEKARLEAERLAKEEQARLEAERIAKEQARIEAERLKEEQARIEAERLAKEEQARIEAERLKEEQARLEAERIAQEEQARIEEERIAQEEEQARLEAERIAQEEQARIEEERIAQEEQARIEEERIAQEELACIKAKLIAQEQARFEAERIAQEQARFEAERIAQQALLNAQTTAQSTSTTTTNISNSHLNMNPAPLFDSTSRKATTEMMMFGLRIFVSRVHKRINIEDVNTGERWSLHLLNQQVQSDWQYQQQQNAYHIPALRINVIVLANDIQIQYLEYGVSTQIQL